MFHKIFRNRFAYNRNILLDIVIGDIFVNDDVQIGAGAVVVKDVKTQGVSVVGVPAHEVQIQK